MADPYIIGTDPSTGYPIFDGGTTVVQGQRPVNLIDALFPRLTSSTADPNTLAGTFTNIAKGIADVGSDPGRFYAALARPESESYLHAAARTAPDPTQDNGIISDAAETVLRDPMTLMGPAVGGALSGTGLLARGLGQAALSAGNNIANDQPINGTSMAMAAGGEALPAIAQGVGMAARRWRPVGNPNISQGFYDLQDQMYNRVPGTPEGDNFARFMEDNTDATTYGGDPNNPILFYHGNKQTKPFSIFAPASNRNTSSIDVVNHGWIYAHENPLPSTTYMQLPTQMDAYDALKAAIANPEKSGLKGRQLELANYFVDNFDKDVNFQADLPMVAETFGIDLPRKGTMLGGYISAKNPLIHDMKGSRYNGNIYDQLIREAKGQGNDMVKILNVHDNIGTPAMGGSLGDDLDPFLSNVAIFPSPMQYKHVANEGPWGRYNPNMYKFDGGTAGTANSAPDLLGRTIGHIARNGMDTLLQGSTAPGIGSGLMYNDGTNQ